MYQNIATVMEESGLWKGSQKESHAFLLSPDVYQITEAQNAELQNLGHALYDCMLGLSHVAVIAYDRQLNYGGAWNLARKVFSAGVPKVYHEFQGMNIKHIPKLLKVDLMVDQNGNFKIAEIDGHNKHGLGYSTLGARFRKALRPHSRALPGVVALLAEEVRRLGYREVKLLYADQEKFYVPEFQVAGQEFSVHGIICTMVSEMRSSETSLADDVLLVDVPFFHHRRELYDIILPAYKQGRIGCIIPPKPFLGAKGVLALLRNDIADDQLEAILCSFIKKQSLNLVRRYIPETVLVGRQAEGIDLATERVARKRFVLKESISSGMKGTVFSDDKNFESVLARACMANANWILQEEVCNLPQKFSWLDGREDPELKTASNWFMRVTVHYVNRQLGDIVVTARRDKAVHGGKDCIHLGTIVL